MQIKISKRVGAQVASYENYFTRTSKLKKLIWVYFLLLIFEGSLRKWCFTGLSAPLLVVRDPLGVWIIWEAIRARKWPKQWSAITGALTIVLSVLCLIQIVWGINVWFAGVYGIRSYLLPFPVAFAIGENIDKKDIQKFAKCTLYLITFMAPLYVMQYKSSNSSLWNAGAYEGSSQINYEGEHVRAAGTFSYNIGATYFSLLGSAFILYGLGRKNYTKKWLLRAALFALAISVPMIGARTLVYLLLLEVLCVGMCAFLNASQLISSLKLTIPIVTMLFLASMTPVFSDASKSMLARFSEASGSEGNTGHVIQKRSLNTFVDAFDDAIRSDHPLGVGMGRGAAAITALMVGRAGFVTGETEISRNLMELGLCIGTAFTIFRFGLAAFLLIAALRMAQRGDSLALLLSPVTIAPIVWGIMEMPTVQGFMIMATAFTLASLKQGQDCVPVEKFNRPRLPHGQSIVRANSRPEYTA